MTPTLPLILNSDVFRAKWDEYVRFRREAKFRKLMPSTVQRRWDMLASWGQIAAIKSIDEAMAQQYQGLFEPKTLPREKARRASFA